MEILLIFTMLVMWPGTGFFCATLLWKYSKNRILSDYRNSRANEYIRNSQLIPDEFISDDWLEKHEPEAKKNFFLWSTIFGPLMLLRCVFDLEDSESIKRNKK